MKARDSGVSAAKRAPNPKGKHYMTRRVVVFIALTIFPLSCYMFIYIKYFLKIPGVNYG